MNDSKLKRILLICKLAGYAPSMSTPTEAVDNFMNMLSMFELLECVSAYYAAIKTIGDLITEGENGIDVE